jgi:Flp pilus assembly CpaE family ATPase
MRELQKNYQFEVDTKGSFQAPGSGNSVNTNASSYLDPQYPDSFGTDPLSIALIGPDEQRRRAVAYALAGCQGSEVREFTSYPPGLDDVPRLLEQRYDVIVIDLDSNPEYALELVESIGANGVATVMVYSAKADPDLLVRCMRAGAREFLTLPFAPNTMAEAMVRAAARRPANRPKKAGGKLLVFFGAKGGAGVTTLACNFAVALAQDTSQSTVLIDLDLPLGDAALNLGLVAEYSTVSALQESSRLDASFLSKLLVKHDSGLYVLAAPGKLPQYQATNESIDRLLTVARQDFDSVVIDVGSRLDFAGTSLFKEAKTVYLVTQAAIPELRNSNRLISQFFSSGGSQLEVVINRYDPRALGVSDESITKALTRPANWKIPNDFSAVRQMQNTGVPLVLEDSSISRLIREMASAVTGLPLPQEKKKGFSFLGLGRGGSAKSASTDEPLSITRVTSGPSNGGSASSATQSDSKSNALEPVVPAPVVEAKREESPARITPKQQVEPKQQQAEPKQQAETKKQAEPKEPAEPETRVYKGVTYVRGADGQWHLQADAAPVVHEQPVVTTHQPPATAHQPAVAIQQPVGVADQPNGMSETAPTITWPKPAPISCGTPLSAAQLNATSSVPGMFTYAPGAGYALAAGTHTLLTIFTPTDSAKYPAAQASVQLVVNKAIPAITWSKPASITCGVPLSASQLNAAASVPGKFTYAPAAGNTLPAGTHTLSATFTPADGSRYTPAQASVQLVVTKATPVITWQKPASISYKTALSAAQLNATASVPGSFAYTPSAGQVLAAGTHTLSVTFNPTDAAKYTPAQFTVELVVTKAMPTITWPKPASISYGTALSATQLNATASVPGTFAYAFAAGDVLAAGTQTLTVTFTPTDVTKYAPAQSSVQLVVTKATPVITWTKPGSISYGAALSAEQLNATASVPGTFTYTPAAGAVLAAGIQTLSVTFTPTDATDYTPTQSAVSLTVTKANPVISWSQPDPITYGTALSATQLNASASVPGRFTYTPAAGDVLTAGTQTLTATFTPTAAADFATAQSAVTLTVAKATPAIKWPKPAPISYGTALSTSQLNATASIPGKFVYTPVAGDVLAAGTQTLSVTFTPTDIKDYTIVQSTVSLTVAKATPAITWPKPAPIAYGTELGANQLKAKASVGGTFTYTPAAGDLLAAGAHTLSATFTPDDAANYTTAQSAVSLSVTKSTPVITWAKPAPITYGTALSAAQLNATASVEGTFAYIPGVGAVLSAGTHRPSVTFTPADATNCAMAQAAVSLTVTKAMPIITWPTPTEIAYGTALSAAQLNATASVPGTFVYTPTAGEMLSVGAQTLSVTFTPLDVADYVNAHADVSLTVTGATATVVMWQPPADIVYGTPLSASQLNATAPVPGAFVYAPGAGEVLKAGTHTLSAIFTPADANLPMAEVSVPLNVKKATPAVTWLTPSDIAYGTPLSAAQLNAKASVPGTFTYTPAAGEVLKAGRQTLSATFTPAADTDFASAEASVSLTITKATPAITWAKPAPISYGTALSADQLNATASVDGTFAYMPGPGNVLTAGVQTLSVAFIPADIEDYTTGQATVSLTVEGMPNIVLDIPDAFDPDAENNPQSLEADGANARDGERGIESSTAPVGATQTTGTQTQLTSNDNVDRNDHADTNRGASQSGKPSNPQGKPETRSYKGATYVKGADGQWHLQQK